MKTNKSVLLAFFPLLAIVFFACQKDVSQSPSLTSNARGVTPQVAPTTLSVGLDFIENQLKVNQEVTINFTSNPSGITCGRAQIQVAVDAEGNPTYDGTVVDWLDLGDANLSTESYPTATFTPTQVGTLTFRAFYTPASGPLVQGGCGYSAARTIITKEVISECVPGLTATLDNSIFVSGPDAKGKSTYEVTVTYHLQNCDGTSGKLQGGLVNFVTDVQTDGTISEQGHNDNGAPVITWDPVGTGSYTVTYKVTNVAGISAPITGTWTYSGNGHLYSAAPVSFNFQ